MPLELEQFIILKPPRARLALPDEILAPLASFLSTHLGTASRVKVVGIIEN